MGNVRQYIAWCERRIERLVVSEGLHCGLLGVTQGPLIITFRVRLLQPSPAALRKLLGLGPALSQILQVSSVRITEQPGHIAIEFPSPVKRTPRAEELARFTRGMKIAVGYDANRRPIHVDLEQHGALFWIGPSRRGKTQSMKSTLYALCRSNGERLRYAILCHERKRKDWQSFEDAVGCMGVVTKPSEQERVLSWAAGELLTLQTPFSFVILCDDLLNLLAQADLAGYLAELASMGAGLGVHLLAGTQEAGSKRGTGGAGVENNATARILYRNSSAAAAARATGQSAEGLQQISGAKGDALLLQDGEPLRIATGLADDRNILQLPQGSDWLRPWLHTTSSQPMATGDNRSQPQQPVATLPHEDTSAASAKRGGAQPVEVVAQQIFPITKRSPTAQECAVITELYSSGKSLNQLCMLVYGHKDGKAFNWVKQSLSMQHVEEKATTAFGLAEHGSNRSARVPAVELNQQQ